MRTVTAAGRELDALVAEKVMGWTDVRWAESREYAVAENPATRIRQGVLSYSTDIGAAWAVVEKLRADDWWFSLVQDNTDIWDVCFWMGESHGWFPRIEARAHEQQAPHSICVAALAASEVSDAR